MLVSAQQRLRHEVTMDNDLGELGGVLTAPACSRGPWMIRSHMVGDEVQIRPMPRAASTCLALATALRPPNDHRQDSRVRSKESHNIVGLPIGKSRVEADP